MRLVFLVEERSMKELLETILPKIIPEYMEKSIIIPHNGKSDLINSIPKKIKGWNNPNDKFIIVHDQDSNDCLKLKEELLSLCSLRKNDCLVRIVCKELEAWYFGDINALSIAYGEKFNKLINKQKFRNPDNLGNAKQELRKLIPEHQQILGAKLIGQHMDIANNKSYSFNVFVSGVRSMCVAG